MVFNHIFLFLLLWWKPVKSIEIKWTPSESGAPEYSLEERQMLFQLDQQIAASPDPQATLKHVAASNGIDENQLAETLMENRRYLQQGAGGQMTSGTSRTPMTVRVVNTMNTVLVLLYRQAIKHPRVSSALILALFLSAYLVWNAPRNGVYIEGNRGPTTLFVPPSSFVEATMLEPEWWKLRFDASLSSRKLSEDCIGVWRQIEMAEKKRIKNKRKKKQLQQSEKAMWYSDFPPMKSQMIQLSRAAVIERHVNLDGLLSQADDEEDENDSNVQQMYHDLIQDQVEYLLIARPQLTEFVSRGKVRFFSSDQEDDQIAALMVHGLGRWGRIGYIPLAIQQSQGDEKLDSQQTVVASVVFSPLKETFWEGNDIHIRVLQQARHGTESQVFVQVALTFSKDENNKDKNTNKSPRRPLPKALASRMVETICDSLQSSLETRTRQAWIRKAQSARFASRAKQSAKERRETRASRERQIEEMAADRRRRRYSQNPNQGRYRPSGERMRSPNNAVYK